MLRLTRRLFRLTSDMFYTSCVRLSQVHGQVLVILGRITLRQPNIARPFFTVLTPVWVECHGLCRRDDHEMTSLMKATLTVGLIPLMPKTLWGRVEFGLMLDRLLPNMVFCETPINTRIKEALLFIT